jgi:outer membrane murein-binding lipoprotein Lpp
MKTFFAGIVVASIGFSGVANILNVGLNIVQTHAEQLNSQLEQLEQN